MTGNGPRKLVLKRETLRILDGRQLGGVRGAGDETDGCTSTASPTVMGDTSNCVETSECSEDCVETSVCDR